MLDKRSGVACAILMFTLGLSTTVAQASIHEQNFRLAHQSTADSPQGQSMRFFADLVNKRSDGKMHIKIYDSDVLGDESQVISLAQSGSVDLIALPPQPLTKIVPDMRIWGFPGLFSKPEIASKFAKSKISEKILSEFSERSKLTGIAVWPTAYRVVMNNVRPIKKVEDFKNLKLRVIQDKLFLDMFGNLGAKPVTISWSDVYTSLETGVVDGTDTVLISAYMAGFYDVQKYLTLTNHVFDALTIVGNTKILDNLDPEERDIIFSSARDTVDFQVKKGMEVYSADVKKMKDHGVQVNKLKKSEWDKMIDLMAKATQGSKDGIDDGILKSVYKTIDEIEHEVDKAEAD